ncbi:sulfotransferase [Paracoccus aerodenitrificans]|uniref:sulfotransferase n=1 Tax=Paracoccus aerodenitrificans TaxID=3017781 RepID=UPI0022F0B483|nr:sulfotransferase [Paracoccus aerodenitrificans]WBU63471.1 sulfotransferase [Paracoccus aerodenitrificans]
MTFDLDAVQAHYQPLRDEAKKQGKIPVISHERFSGYPASGGFDATILASRLHRSFPDGRILIIVREQLASIFSMYSQYITDGGHMSLRNYLSPREPFLKRRPGFSEEFYRYHRLVAHYRKLFGENRVLCMPYELLVRDRETFFSALFSFVGRDPFPVDPKAQNVRRPALFQICQRVVNSQFSANELSHYYLVPLGQFRRRFGSMAKYVPTRLTRPIDTRLERRMRSLLASKFGEAFAQSNGELSQMIGIDLSRYGYQMPQNFNLASEISEKYISISA